MIAAKKLAYHNFITGYSGVNIFFCDTHSSLQNGTNINTKGHIRQYIPQRIDLNTVPEWVMDEIQGDLNERPRKILDFDNPKQ